LTTIPTRATRLADAGLPACAYVVAKYHNRSVVAAELMAAILELAEAVADGRKFRGKVKIDREAMAQSVAAALADFGKVSKA